MRYTSALPGSRFGRLTVVSVEPPRSRRCRCDCGEETVVLTCNLATGNTQSCGCLRREVERICSLTHGATSHGRWTRCYRIWHGIIQRCCNPANTAWSRYGGRGITICTEWRDSFEAFRRDMGEPPAGYSIERIDVNGNYCKENCRWATDKEQQRNKRSNRFLTFKGETMPLAEWAEKTGIPYYTIHARLRRGWSDNEALSGVRYV